MTSNNMFSWLTDGPVDYELKQYKMLAILTRLRNELAKHKVWTVIEEVESQLDHLYRLKYEIEVKDEQLRIPKDIDFLNFEIIYEKMDSELITENNIMDQIVDDAIVEFNDIYMDAREEWRSIEKLIRVTWIPKRPPLLNKGYVIVPDNDKYLAYYFEKPTKLTKSWRTLKLEFVESFKIENNALPIFCEKHQNLEETIMFSRISIDATGLPHDETVMPVVKSVLFNSLVKNFV